MVASIYSGEEGSYFREEINYYGDSGRLPALEEGEPCNEGWMGGWINLEVTFLGEVRVFWRSLVHGLTKEFGEFRKSPLTKSQGQSKRLKGIKVIWH